MKFSNICILVIFIAYSEFVSAQDHYIAKIAVVDVESILENSLAITSIRKSINELSENIQKEITEQEKEFKKRQDELLELQQTLDQKEFDSLVLKFNKNVSAIQKNIQLKKIAMEQAHSQAIEVVHKKTISVISELAKEYNFNVVLPSTQVLYVTSELNITLEVISRLNKGLKTVPINYQKFLKK